jgi:hypothetical protein
MTRRTFLASAALLPAARAASAAPPFVLGLYQLPKSGDPWREAADAGFNLVHIDGTREQLDLAQRNRLHAWVTVGSVSPGNRAGDVARIRGIVEKLKDHPALLFWETEDEPSYQWKKAGPRIPPEQIVATYRFVKSLDPRRPIYLNHAPTNLVSTLRQYNAGADIVATDIYPVIPHGIREEYALWPDGMQGDLTDTTIGQVGGYARKMRQVAGSERSVFMVLQAFAWENLRERDRNPAMVLYPTRAQLRFMTWDAIVQGVNGVLYWGLSYTPTDAPLWPDLKAVTAEVRQFLPELGAPPARLNLKLDYHDTGHSLDRGVEWIARRGPEGLRIFAINADRNPVDVTFSGLPAFSRCEVRLESRKLDIQGGAFRDTFQPFDVHIYSLY